MSARYDCCPGVHREDELCSRTAVQTLPLADDGGLLAGIPEAVEALSAERLPKLQAFNESVRATSTETNDERGVSA